MVLTMAVFCGYAALWLLMDIRISVLGWLAAAMAIATVYSTAMIYAQLRTVPRWSGTPTPAMFVIFSGTNSLIGCGAMLGFATGNAPVLLILAVIALTGATAIWWQTQAAGAGRGMTGSSMETATGLAGIGRVRLLEAPHTGSNYLLKEMAYQVGRTRAFQLRKIGAIMGIAVPFALALLSMLAGPWMLILALFCHVAGMLALRWLFFAEAEHVQALYYGQR